MTIMATATSGKSLKRKSPATPTAVEEEEDRDMDDDDLMIPASPPEEDSEEKPAMEAEEPEPMVEGPIEKPKRRRPNYNFNGYEKLRDLKASLLTRYEELNAKQATATTERDKQNIACQKCRINQKLKVITTKLTKTQMEDEMQAMREEIAKLKAENHILRRDREIWEKEKDILMAMIKPYHGNGQRGSSGNSGQKRGEQAQQE